MVQHTRGISAGAKISEVKSLKIFEFFIKFSRDSVFYYFFRIFSKFFFFLDKKKVPISDYKSNQYFDFNAYSFYELETEMTGKRLPQPDPKVPDSPRDTNPPAPKPAPKK